MDQGSKTGRVSPKTIRQTGEQQPSSWFRRQFLTMLGGVATAAVAGCSGMTQHEFEADPVILTKEGRGILGVSEVSRDTETVTRKRKAGGVEAEVSMTNHFVVYSRGQTYKKETEVEFRYGEIHGEYTPTGRFTRNVNGTTGPGSAVMTSCANLGVDAKGILEQGDSDEPIRLLMKYTLKASPELPADSDEDVILVVPAGCREDGVVQSGRLLALIPAGIFAEGKIRDRLFAEGKIRESAPEGPYWSIPAEDFFPPRTGWLSPEVESKLDTTPGIQQYCATHAIEAQHQDWIEVLGILGAGRADHGAFQVTGTPSAYGVTPEEMPGERHETAATLPTGDGESDPIFAVPYPVEATPLAGMDAGQVFNYGAGTQTIPAPLRGSTFGIGILSTPAAEVGGQSLNPVGDMEFSQLLSDYLLQWIYTDLDWVSGPTEVSLDAPSMVLLGQETDLRSFVGILGDENPQWNVGVHMARVQAEDNIVILAGTHCCPIAGEAGTSQQKEPPGILRTRAQSGAATTLPASEETKAVAFSATTSQNGFPGEPIKWWCPGDFNDYFTKYNIKVAPGQSGTDVMAIESQKDLENVELWISPEIDPYISFEEDTTFAELDAGRKTVTGKVDMPSDEKVGTTYDGTVEIKNTENNRTYPRVLEIHIEVVEKNSNQLTDAGDPRWGRANI